MSERIKYIVNTDDCKGIPSNPIAYWVSQNFIDSFNGIDHIENVSYPKQGLHTGNNDAYIRFWHEVSSCDILFESSDTWIKPYKWAKLNKGGTFRKWYGNLESVILWENDGFLIKNNGKSVGATNKTFLKNLMGFTDITTYIPSFRFYGKGFVYDVSGPSLINDETKYSNFYLIGLLNSKVTAKIMSVLSPTLHMNQTALGRMAIKSNKESICYIESLSKNNIDMSKSDWDYFETSWDFKKHPLI